MESKHIYTYIERLSNLLRNETRRGGLEYGLQPVQIDALHYLSICNTYSDTPMGVTEYLGQTKGTVSQSLKVLEKKAYLVKRTDEKDKRITHLKLTGSGKKLIKTLISTSQFIQASNQLDIQFQAKMISSLKVLLQVMQQTNGLKSFGVCHTCRHNQKNDDTSYFCNLTKESLSQADIHLICREHETR